MKLFTWANLLTLTNLFFGSLACIFYVWTQSIEWVGLCILISLICDFFDGFVARKTGTDGPLGVQLDSLADVISFGLVPAILMFFLLLKTYPHDILMIDFNDAIQFKTIVYNELPVLAFIGIFVVLFSALRLAQFNVDTEQNYYFKGLNTPTNTLALYSLTYIEPSHFYVILGIVLLSCYLLVSTIPMFSLKLKDFDLKKDFYLIILLVCTIIGLSLYGIPSIIYLIGLYILLSLIFRKQFTS